MSPRYDYEPTDSEFHEMECEHEDGPHWDGGKHVVGCKWYERCENATGGVPITSCAGDGQLRECEVEFGICGECIGAMSPAERKEFYAECRDNATH